MASIAVRRSDLFPIGTTVGAYPANTIPPGSSGPPQTNTAAIASAAVDAAGLLTITNAGIVTDVPYVLYALVGGQPTALRTQVSSANTLSATDATVRPETRSAARKTAAGVL